MFIAVLMWLVKKRPFTSMKSLSNAIFRKMKTCVGKKMCVKIYGMKFLVVVVVLRAGWFLTSKFAEQKKECRKETTELILILRHHREMNSKTAAAF